MKSTQHSSHATDQVGKATSIESLVAQGFKLEEVSSTVNFEHSAQWFDLLQKQVFPDDENVRFYFLPINKEPSLIFPVRLTKTGRIKAVESLGNFYTSLYAPLQSRNCDLSSLSTMLSTASEDHHGAHMMHFSPMDPDSPAYQAIFHQLRVIGWIPFRFYCFGNWYLKANNTWEEYLKERTANQRSTIKRMTKKLAADQGTLEVVATDDQLEPAIAAFQEVYLSSWKKPEPFPEFVPSLIRRLATLGMLRLGIAWLQGRPIAAQLWIVGQDKASIYKVAYHEDFAAYSPGTVLTAHLMQHVIDRDHVKEVDFLIGDDKYKQIWMSDRRERWGIVAYNPRTLIGFALLLKEVLARTTKTLRTRINSRLKRSDRNSEPARRKATPN